MSNGQIKLPFWEVISKSFGYVFKNSGTVAKASVLWLMILVYEVLAGFPYMQYSFGSDGIAQRASLILLAVASVGISVALSRSIILGTKYKTPQFSFGVRELKYLFYFIMLMLGIIIVSFALAILAGIIIGFISPTLMETNMIDIGGRTVPFYLFLVVLAILVSVFIFFSRFFLVFAGIAVDNKAMTLRKSFALTKGNANKIFWGIVLMGLPVYFLSSALFYLIISSGFTSFVGIFAFTALAIIIKFLDFALRASFFSHVYQYIVNSDKKENVKISLPVKKEVVVEKKEETAKKVVAPKKATSVKKVVVKKEPAKKTEPKKTEPAKVEEKKVTVVAKKAPVKKVAAKKTASAVKKPAPKKAVTKKAPVKKPIAK